MAEAVSSCRARAPDRLEIVDEPLHRDVVRVVDPGGSAAASLVVEDQTMLFPEEPHQIVTEVAVAESRSAVEDHESRAPAGELDSGP